MLGVVEVEEGKMTGEAVVKSSRRNGGGLVA
jgi:hypothetical protein